MSHPAVASTEAERIAEEFKQFAYTVSHDLSAPLRGMVEFSKLLKAEAAENLSADAKEYLTLIVESGQKVQAMITGLLEYSRLNTLGTPLRNIDANRILSDCALVFKDVIAARKSKLDIAPMPTVRADPEQLQQLFVILLDNAFKFHTAQATPHVSVSATKEGAEWRFTVRDNGIGIEEPFQQRIFNIFQRLHAEGEYPGVGMGLALAYKIVHRHGGRIWLESAAGQGAAFHFTIPEHE